MGDEVTATVASDVKDASGRVVVPAGSKVMLKVTAIKPSDSKSDTTGTLSLDAGRRRSERQGSADRRHDLRRDDQAAGQGHRRQRRRQGRRGGTAAGAIVGRVLGGSSKGAIIGGIIGGAVGTQRAVETKDRDVVLPAGTSVTLTLDQKFVAQLARKREK